ITQQIVEWVRKNALTLKFPDNDPLIALFGNNFTRLQDIYNHTGRSGTEWSVPVEQARMIHFTGIKKPDFSDCRHPARAIFLRHRQNTPWRDQPLTDPRVRRWRVLGERVANRLNLIRHRY